MTEAAADLESAADDMEVRIRRLHEDKMGMFDREAKMVKAALDRAVVDHKDPCSVLRAIRVEFTRDIICTPNSTTVITFDTDITF